VVFEALPGGQELLRQPPRPLQAPLLDRRSLRQGGLLTLAALALALWPDGDDASRRSLVLSLLLLSGGGLVWINGDRRSAITLAGVGIGAGLWLLLLLSPWIQRSLALAPLSWPQAAAVLFVALLALALADVLGGPAYGWADCVGSGLGAPVDGSSQGR
jgi:Ca2+-transporting ATPase